MRGEDLQARIVDGDEDDEHVPAGRSPSLLVVRKSGLVPMVTVGDQELAIGEGLRDRSRLVEPPEPGALDLEVRRPLGDVERPLAFVEEEDRLELGADLAQDAETPLLRPAVRALVGQHGSRLVRLDLQRPDQARPCSRDSVGTDVVLGQRPEPGLVRDQDLLVAPFAEEPPRLGFGLRKGQMNDVVGALSRGSARAPRG